MKTCIITGASGGIGRAVAIKLSELNEISNFILIARNREKLLETMQMMNNKKNIKIYDLDLSDLENVKRIIEEIGDEFGQIDILTNIAGYANPQFLFETTIENWEKTFNINVTVMFLLIRESVKYMKKNGGKILNIASTAGMTSRPGWLAYSTSKSAVISMSKTLSDELKEYGIKVYCVSPGRCATELRKILAPDEDPKTIMQPEDVANVIHNLISSNGDCLDGQNIIVRKQI